MTDSNDPVLRRVRDGLAWPSWSTWHDSSSAALGAAASIASTAADAADTDYESRNVSIRRRLALARSIDDGGPYIEVFAEQARTRVETEMAAGQPVGPLGTFTVAVKELLAIEGRPMTAGSAVRADAPAESATAPMLTRLEALGAVTVGVVTLHEFAFGVTGVNPHAGTAINPKAPDRITGGSSSGSAAAVADGSARIAIGTDTGGSIRGPASFCGVVGFKPSFGLYPSQGVFPLSGTLDHVGLFASNVADIATVHSALGHPTMPPELPARIGIARGDISAADSDVQELMSSAIAALDAAGCELVDVSWPDAERTFVASTAIMFSEAAAIHADSVASHGDRYGDDIRARLELGASLTPLEVATAHEYRRGLIAEVTATLDHVDVIIGPTTPMVAPPVAKAADPALPPRIVSNTRLGNVVGLPAISIPLPAHEAPVGMQVLGLDDAAVLSHAAAMANVLDSIDA